MTVNDLIGQYKDNLTFRFETMRRALELLHEHGGKTIIETGTTRMHDDWGAGMSTFIFGLYCKEFNARLTTVDIDQRCIDISREVTKDYEDYITYVTSDSISYLYILNNKIDLLYLDSMDCPIEDDENNPVLIASQNHQLNEMRTAIGKMSDNGIVLLDDTEFKNGGKARLTREYLQEQGWKEDMKGYQSLWIR